MAYVDFVYYVNDYKGGVVPDSAFPTVIRRAEAILRKRTLMGINPSADYMPDVKLCLCEMADEIYKSDLRHAPDGSVLASYSNDGESGNFTEESISDEGLAKRLESIMLQWLFFTGLMYRGL